VLAEVTTNLLVALGDSREKVERSQRSAVQRALQTRKPPQP
jgi:hypothetical protein